MHKPIPLFLLLLAGCAVGPNYQAPAVAPESTQVTIRTPDSVQAKLDTVMQVRDSLLKLKGEPSIDLKSGTTSDVAWLNLLQDTVLVQLVRRALEQNRDIQIAMARVREARALAGAAKGPLYPQLYANGAVSTNQVVFGTFGAQRYDAVIIQANLQWEIEFWGGIRRSVEAANDNLGEIKSRQQALGHTAPSVGVGECHGTLCPPSRAIEHPRTVQQCGLSHNEDSQKPFTH